MTYERIMRGTADGPNSQACWQPGSAEHNFLFRPAVVRIGLFATAAIIGLCAGAPAQADGGDDGEIVVAQHSSSANQPTLRLLNAKLEALEAELAKVRNQLAAEQAQSADSAAKIEKIAHVEKRVESLEAAPARAERQNVLTFRGGYSSLADSRGNQFFTDAFDGLGVGPVLGAPRNEDDSGYYVGAAFDFNLTDNAWGMFNNTTIFAELGLEYKRFGGETVLQVLPTTANFVALSAGLPQPIPAGTCEPATLSGVNLVCDRVRLTMLSITASPKIKFFKESKIRPWLIPIGLGIHVISPPSDSGTVLDIGAHFGAGIEYEIAPGVFAGTDIRYNITANQTDDFALGEFSNRYYTAGAYVSLGF